MASYSRYNLPDLRKTKLCLLERRGEAMTPRKLFEALAWLSFVIIGAFWIVMVLLIVAEAI